MTHRLRSSTLKRELAVAVRGFVWALMAFPCLSPGVSAADTQPAADRVERQLINRAVLTVGRDVFTALDAAAIVMIWNLTRGSAEKVIESQTDWLQPLELGATSRLDPIAMMNSWSDDVRLLFKVALIWVDVQKLNLFILQGQEADAVLRRFNEGAAPEKMTNLTPLQRRVFASSDAQKRKWIEYVLRVRAFMRVRGAPEANRNLFSVSWYWHNTGASKAPVK